MDKLVKLIGERIKEYRKAQGWTQEQLAECAELSVNYLATMEIGRKTPSIRTLARLADALGVEICDLLAGKAEQEQSGLSTYVFRSLDSLSGEDAEFTKALIEFLTAYFASCRRRTRPTGE